MVKRYALGKVLSLGSSSAGNAYYIEINRKGYLTPYKLLIECGFQYNKLASRALTNNIHLKDLNAVLVSHEHHDHSICVPNFIGYQTKVFAPKGVFKHFGVLDEVNKNQIMADKKKVRIADGIDVLGMELEHKNSDGTKVENLGYIIEAKCDYGIHRILFVTDTKFIKYDLSNRKFNTIFLEANNFRRNIMFSMKDSQQKGEMRKATHYERVLNSHMLVENTIKTLVGSKKNKGFDLSETDRIFLIHATASGNANYQEIKTKVQEALKESGRLRVKEMNGKTYISPKVFVFRKNGEMI